MIVMVLPSVGPDDGQICEECAHIDCADYRLTIGQPCRYCGEALKSGDRYAWEDEDGTGKPAHYVCILESEVKS